jgi:formylglycine-generating enzyme required for sulfatase activity
LTGIARDTSKHGYRLPTEAEWEYACQAGSSAATYWGHASPPATSADTLALDSNAVWPDNSGSQTQSVAGKKPNAFGLYDMVGNVGEWCNDWYDGAYYSGSPTANPTGPATGTQRVIRGGTWLSDGSYLRTAYRVSRTPDSQFNYYGFRCVK